MTNSLSLHLLTTVILTILLSGATTLFAQKRLLVMGWNVESGDNSRSTIVNQIEDFEGYDIIGLTEVKFSNVDDYEEAFEDGEGTSGNSNADFQSEISTTGGGDRMVIVWDNKRLELVGSVQELHDLNTPTKTHRSPFFGKFRFRNGGQEFLFMVNHLARGNASLRETQAGGLKTWVESQTVPVIAVGDYNFDYDIDEGIGNQGLTNMLEDNSWEWVKPERIHQTQLSSSFYSVLDFIFVSHIPSNWSIISNILFDNFPPYDDGRRSDHRPIEAVVYIH